MREATSAVINIKNMVLRKCDLRSGFFVVVECVLNFSACNHILKRFILS